MTRAALIMCLLLVASLASTKEKDERPAYVPRKMSLVTDADAWRELTGNTEERPFAAQPDTTVLLHHRFDTGYVICDEMGWSLNDDTQQLDNYWHVDDFAGLAGIHGGLIPLEGNQSMWCGARPDANDLIKCSYVNLPGYANHWNQWIRTDRCLNVTGDVYLSFQIFWDTEYAYDYIYIQWDECDDTWDPLIEDYFYNELHGLGQLDTTLTLADTLHSSGVRFRFLLQSDATDSDGDGKLDTDGACTIDMLRVDDEAGNVLALEDFEDEAVGDHHGDGWISETHPGYGELAVLYPGSKLVQDDPCISNITCSWAFINGSTSDYTCGTPAHPEQATVPYENARGQYVDQQIWSPWIDIRTCSGGVFELSYLIYADLQIPAWVFSDFHVRGIDSTSAKPCPSLWFGDGFVGWGGHKTWRVDVAHIGTLIPNGSTHIQVSLDVIDYCQFGYPCASSCHSHAPLYDNVKVYCVNAVGPQWTVEDMHQFQDNFPDDGTITGTARADMAMDLNWDKSEQAIVPGDSATVSVSDPVAGLDTDAGGKAAVFCYVSIDGPHSGTAPAGLICDSRYAYVADESWGGRTWHKFQADSCYTREGDVVPGDYNFDFCDDLFVPGDTIWFFWGARNTDGVYTYASAALATPGNQTRYGNEAADDADEFQVLPAVGRDVADGGRGGEVLYVDGMNFRGAQPYFDTTFRQEFGMLHEVDRYDIRGPSSGVGNHPGNRVKDVLNQLVPIYKVILWNTGDLETAFADGTGDLDKSDDTGLCLAFMDNIDNERGGIYLDGDHVATEWMQMTAPSALSLRTTFMNFDVTASAHQPVVGYNPWGIGVSGGAFGDSWALDSLVVQGGCKTPKAFDVLAATGGAQVQMNYHDWTGWFGSVFDPAIVSQSSQNPMGVDVGFMLSGFSFHHIRDFEADGYVERFRHMRHILEWFGMVLDMPLAAGAPNARRNALAQNVPNPFNPTTTIRYEVKETGPVSLKVYNVAGQLVKTLVDGPRSAGRVYEVRWNGLNDSGQPAASGVYFYRLAAKGFTQTRKMVILK